MLAQCRQCSFSPNGDVLIAVFDDATVWRFDYRNYARKRELTTSQTLPYELNGTAKVEKQEPEIKVEHPGEEYFPEPEHTEFSKFIRSIGPQLQKIENAHKQSKKTD